MQHYTRTILRLNSKEKAVINVLRCLWISPQSDFLNYLLILGTTIENAKVISRLYLFHYCRFYESVLSKAYCENVLHVGLKKRNHVT